MTTTPPEPTPWYKQRWPWILIALPGSAVIASIATVIIAVTTADGVVLDDYYRQGKAINRSLERDREATRLGLTATIIRGQKDALRVIMSEPIEGDLRLSFTHATLDKHDQKLTLNSRDGRVFDGALDPLRRGRWRIQLEPAESGGTWRLRGSTTNSAFERLDLGETTVERGPDDA